MVNQQTQQFMYRAVITTACGILSAIFLFLFIAALRMGDGEAVKIIDAVQPLAMSVLGAMVTTVLGSHAAGAFIAKVQANAPGVPMAPAAPAPADTSAPSGV